MKLTRFSILAIFLVSTVSLPNAFAQDYTQWHLPEGMKARLGKGTITGNVQYSPDGALLAVGSFPSVFGFTRQIPTKKLTYSQDMQLGSPVLLSLQTGRRLPAAVKALRFTYGIWELLDAERP